jgi:hypothetical protein
VSEWETKAAIHETLSRYSGAAGRMNIEEFLALFTEDAEVHGTPELMGLPGPFKGHEGIRGFFGPAFEAMEWLSQQNTTTDIWIGSDGKTAKTSSSLVEMAKREGYPQIVLIARYDDELALTDEGWKFTKRTLVPYRFEQV